MNEWLFLVLLIGLPLSWAGWMIGIYVRGVWQQERVKGRRLRD